MKEPECLVMVLISIFSFVNPLNVVYAQMDKDSQWDTSADVIPQGTSLNATNETNSSQQSLEGDVATDVKPQGTSLESKRPNADTPSDTSGNVSADVIPQGTSLQG